MPNHVTNIFHINSCVNDTQLSDIKDFIEGENESPVSFQQIRPMPAELEANPATGVSDDITEEETRRRKLLYGASDWYDWHIKYWGTKWDCYDVIKICENEFEFRTAWSTPEEIIKYLSKKFPTVKFQIEFADEDVGSNCGSYTYLDGEKVFSNYPTLQSEEAVLFSCSVNSYSSEDTEEALRNHGFCRREKETLSPLKLHECPECGSVEQTYTNSSGELQCDNCGYSETE